jgi:ABC-type transporter Mla subunit MlaD
MVIVFVFVWSAWRVGMRTRGVRNIGVGVVVVVVVVVAVVAVVVARTWRLRRWMSA